MTAPGELPNGAPFQAILGKLMPQSSEEAPQAPDSQPSSFNTEFAATSMRGTDAAFADNVSKPNPQDQVPQLLDPAFEIRKEATAHLAGVAIPAKDSAPSTDVAFRARIAERTISTPALGVNGEQQAIAASRFDVTDRAAQTNPEDRPAFPVSPDVPVNPGAAVNQDSASNREMAAPGVPGNPAPLRSAAVNPVPKVMHAQQAQLAADNVSSAGNAVRSKDEAGKTESTADAAPASHTTSASSQTTASFPGPITTAPAPLTIANAHSRETGAGKAALGAAPQTSSANADAKSSAGEAVRDISLRLSSSNQPPVQVRLSERAGELHVSVRTPDAGLSRGLRDSLPDLVERLQVNGYRAETWRPDANSFSAGQDRGHEAPSHGDSSQHRNSGGSGSFGQQSDQQGHRQGEEQPPEWRRELESTLQRSNKIWQPSPTL